VLTCVDMVNKHWRDAEKLDICQAFFNIKEMMAVPTGMKQCEDFMMFQVCVIDAVYYTYLHELQ
jgi:hypothetical protein